MIASTRPFVLAGLLAAAACERPPAAEPDPAGAARARVGVVFDPGAAEPGDSIAGLVVVRAEVQRTDADSTAVGSITFRGPLALGGRLVPHPDGDARAADGGAPVCFEADSASASRMPRWAGDRRRPWFCFVNADEARATLGTGASGEASRSITIDDFTIHRGLSDQVNSARFVGLADR